MAEQILTDIRPLRRSPLADLTDLMAQASVTGERGVRLREIPFLNMVGIRVQPGSDAAHTFTSVTGVPLPAGHGQVTGDTDTLAILWQGPDEFLLVSPDKLAAEIDLPGARRARPDNDAAPADAARAASDDAVPTRSAPDGAAGSHVVDLSANRTTLELSGPSARAVLEKGCPLDLHPRVFGPGTAVSTTLGLVQVLLWQTDEQTWRIMPRSSFAVYIAQWLMDAMTEFASQEVA
ncbi:MAG: sarcosine oxidase subunit gamma [Kocuria rhizophila]|nr:MAG: sarcosine oxidase subunit gamma [Kocuria rhizophila]